MSLPIMTVDHTKHGSYNLISWNVRGMGAVHKRHCIHSYLLRHQAHIVFTQETHLTNSESQKSRRNWRGQLISTNFSAFARGAAIWIRHGVLFQEIDRRIDDQGRYVLLRGTLDGRSIVLGSIYAPNTGHDIFLQRLSGALAGWESFPWLLGGDYNAVLDTTQDRSPKFVGQVGHITGRYSPLYVYLS